MATEKRRVRVLIQIPLCRPCWHCGGRGTILADPDGGRVTCPTCEGRCEETVDPDTYPDRTP